MQYAYMLSSKPLSGTLLRLSRRSFRPRPHLLFGDSLTVILHLECHDGVGQNAVDVVPLIAQESSDTADPPPSNKPISGPAAASRPFMSR